MINELREHKELLYTSLPIFVLIFIVFDIGVFDLFGIEIGYFLTIIGNLDFNTYNFIFVLILIPILFILMFVLLLIFSKHINCFVFEKINKNVNIYYLLFLFIVIYIFVLYIIALVLNLTTSSFLISYFLLLILSVSLNILYNLVYKLVNLNDKNHIKFAISQIIIIIIVLTINYLDYSVLRSSNVIFVFAAMLHFFSLLLILDQKKDIIGKTKNDNYDHGFITGKIVDDKKLIDTNSNCTSFNKINGNNQIGSLYLLIAGSILLAMLYIHLTINLDSWKKPVETRMYTRSDLTLNLLFNKGMLINSTENMIVKIPDYYLDKVSSLYFFDKENNEIHIGLESKYLEFGSNLKMYFKNASSDVQPYEKNFQVPIKKVYVILVEEKKFANKKDTTHILLSFSHYNIN